MVTQILEICVIPILGILTKYIIDFLSAKRDELRSKTNNEINKKYIDMVYHTINDCVMTTNQTYVNSLKNAGKFDEAAQKEAFNRTMEAVLSVLSEDTKKYIQEITGDMNLYLTQLIEATVNFKKI